MDCSGFLFLPDLAVAGVALGDLVAEVAAADHAGQRGQLLAVAAADLVADQAADHGAGGDADVARALLDRCRRGAVGRFVVAGRLWSRAVLGDARLLHDGLLDHGLLHDRRRLLLDDDDRGVGAGRLDIRRRTWGGADNDRSWSGGELGWQCGCLQLGGGGRGLDGGQGGGLRLRGAARRWQQAGDGGGASQADDDHRGGSGGHQGMDTGGGLGGGHVFCSM